MPAKRRAGIEPGPAPVLGDTQADLFFTLVAVMLPAILLLLPAARIADDTTVQRAQQAAEALAGAGMTLDGRTAQLFLADGAGIAYGPAASIRVPLAAIQEDPGLRRAMEAAWQDGQPLLVLIAPDGEEAAFLFDAVAARHGPARLAQIRLEPERAHVGASQRAR